MSVCSAPLPRVDACRQRSLPYLETKAFGTVRTGAKPALDVRLEFRAAELTRGHAEEPVLRSAEQYVCRMVREADPALGVEGHQPLLCRAQQSGQGLVGTGKGPAIRHAFLRVLMTRA